MPVEIVLVLVIVVLLLEVGLLIFELDYCDEFITPTYIYEHSKLNKPTCWVLFILFLLTAWFNNVIKIIYLICHFFYWITHVGREDAEED